MNWNRWKGWHGIVTWTLGFIAYHVYMALPWCLAKRCNWMLPRVGDYAYWDDAISRMKCD